MTSIWFSVCSAKAKRRPLQLLTIAHRGEAQHILKAHEFKAVMLNGVDLYQNSTSYLLLTGEGQQAATESVAFVLGQFGEKINHVLNLGVAGSLLSTIELSSIVAIRTSYGESLKQKPAFKSFTSENTLAEADCISAVDRVLSDDYAAKLRPFAAVVDRELWAVASVASRFNTPFSAYKLISDLAGNNTNCFDLSHRAEIFARELNRFYSELNQTPYSGKKTPLAFELPEILKNDFYFTKAQERSYTKLMNTLLQRDQNGNAKSVVQAEDILAQLPIQALRQRECSPKERSQHVLVELKNLLNPFQKRVMDKLNEQVKPLQNAHCDVKFDPSFEKDHLTISLTIEHQSHIEKLKAALAEFDYTQIQKTINGQLGD